MVEEVFTQVWSKPPFVVLLGADGCVKMCIRDRWYMDFRAIRRTI